jgi:site-specific recombinase XerC
LVSEETGCEDCGLFELRQVSAYLTNGHASENGRWDDKHKRKPVKVRTIHTWHGHLRAFFRWMVDEQIISASPMERIAAPNFPKDQNTAVFRRSGTD